MFSHFMRGFEALWFGFQNEISNVKKIMSYSTEVMSSYNIAKRE